MDIFLDMRVPDLSQLRLIPEIVNLIAELDEFKGRWTATQVLTPDRLASLRQVATIESVGSSTRIEGVKLSNSEIEALLRGVKTFSFRSRDEQEVAGYAELMETIFTSYSEIQITENHIKQLHSLLLKYSNKDERHRGEYKKFQNNVEAFGSDGKSKGIIFQTASPFNTPKLMKELVDWVQTQFMHKSAHPLLVVALFAIVFLHIHPFQDGNGRLSRGLTTLLLLKFGYGYVPYSSLERVIEENKDAYYLALRRGQVELEQKEKPKKGSKGIQSWLLFFLESMQKQKAALQAKIKEEFLVANLPRLSLQIIELIKNRGPSSVADVVAATGANRNTVKLHFKTLTKDGYLSIEGAGRGVRYRLNADG